MPTVISDEDDDARRTPLPDSVDRAFGSAVPGSGSERILDTEVLGKVLAHPSMSTKDSNLDRLSTRFEVDVLFDGTSAVRAVVGAIERRLRHPIRPGEVLRLVAMVR